VTASVLSAATLSNPRRVGAEFEFSIVGASNAIYAIEASRDLHEWTMLATNRQLGEVRIISMPASAPEEFYRVRLLRPLFTGALAVREALSAAGGRLRVDSFDSHDPNFSGPGGTIDLAKMRDRAAIITGSALTNSLDLGNSKVLGVLRVPPGATPLLGPSASVGSSEWVNSGQLGIQPGHLVDETNHVFVDVELPRGVYVTPGPGYFGTNYYSYMLSNGYYTLPALTGQPMLVTGRATLYVSTSVRTSGNIVIQRGASLDLYADAPDATLRAVVNQNTTAAAFAYYGLPGNTNVSVGGNTSFVGTIYAPAAAIYFSGGGSDEIDFIGAIVGRSFRVYGKMNLHYDESLAVAGPAL
jgi:hypothetical protein